MSTSSSRGSLEAATPGWGSLVLAALLTGGLFSAWELYTRSLGLAPSVVDRRRHWTHARRLANLSADAVVIVGGSRPLTCLDPKVLSNSWDGRPVFQLGVTAGLGMPVLEELLSDRSFRGSVILGFDPTGLYQPDRTRTLLTQALLMDHGLAPRSEALLAETLLEVDQALASRHIGLFSPHRHLYHWSRSQPTRPRWNSIIRRDRFIEFQPDASTTAIGAFAFMVAGQLSQEPDATSRAAFHAWLAQLGSMLKARGGQLALLYLPTAGPLYRYEQQNFPRKEHWDQAIASTRAPAFHFEDDLFTSVLSPVDGMHLVPNEAAAFSAIAAEKLIQKGFPPTRSQPSR